MTGADLDHGVGECRFRGVPGALPATGTSLFRFIGYDVLRVG